MRARNSVIQLSLLIVLASVGLPMRVVGGESSTEVVAQVDDNRKAEIDRLIAEGNRLRRKGRVESSRQAIKQFERAVQLSAEKAYRVQRSLALYWLGSIYSALGEKQKALGYYNQSLVLDRALGDQAGEAAILNNIGSVYDDLGQKQKALEFYNQALPLYRAVGDRGGEATRGMGSRKYLVEDTYR